MGPKPYLRLVEYHEQCLAQHGDTHLGVDWPNAADTATRHDVMLGVITERPAGGTVRLLDFGCGPSHFYEYIRDQSVEGIEYSGLDLGQSFIDLSRQKFPDNRYYCVDVLDPDVSLPKFDYVVANGVFTRKLELSFDEVFTFMKAALTRLFGLAEVGIAFNVMSKHVDWERDDLFHMPFDVLADFLTADLTRNFVFRNDYGLYEYTTYVYH